MTGIHYLDAKGPEGMRLYAIGDVHGRLDLLEAMFEQIDAQIAERKSADWRIILLGDYVDRGPDSKCVLSLISKRIAKDERVIALAGNHDTGMLAFLDDPLSRAAYLFTQYGGEETLLSYGIAAGLTDEAQTIRAHRQFRTILPGSHLDLLQGLPRSVSFGDFFFCHAGIRPGVELDEQRADDLIWIRGDFLNHTGLHPKVIVHGHTPNGEPEVRANRVNVDTAAFMSGRLTALVIDGAVKDFITVEANSA